MRAKRRESLAQLDRLIQSTFLEMFHSFAPNVALGEACAFSQGIQVPVEYQHTEYREGYVRFLRIIDYTQEDEPRFIDFPGERYEVNSDDIAMVRYGATAGHVGIGKSGVIANNLFKLNFDKNAILPIYLFYCLKTQRFEEFIKKVAFGAAMPALSFKKMNDFAIAIPPLDLQRQFAEIVESIERQKARMRAHLEELDKLFASLQDRAFKGEL